MKDSEGCDIDFKNMVVIMMINVGIDFIKSFCVDFDIMLDVEGFIEVIYFELFKMFKLVFLGRILIFFYYLLFDDVMKKIICLKFGKVM